MEIKADVIDYLGKMDDGVVVSVGVLFEEIYYNGILFYSNNNIVLSTISAMTKKKTLLTAIVNFITKKGKKVMKGDKDINFTDEFGHLFYKTPFTNYRLKLEYRFLGEPSQSRTHIQYHHQLESAA